MTRLGHNTLPVDHPGKGGRDIVGVGRCRCQIGDRIARRRMAAVVDQIPGQGFTQEVQVPSWEPLRVVFIVIQLRTDEARDRRIVAQFLIDL